MPQISELFVALGVKGSEKTLSTLVNVKSGVSGIRDVSLEAKAAILGAVYALEQLTVGATGNAAHLQNFAAYLDMSAESLQRWRYAAQQGHISNQEFDQDLGSIKQKVIDLNALGKISFEGAGIFAQHTHLDTTRPLNVGDVFEKGLNFALDKEVPQDTKVKILSSLGFTPSLIGAALQGMIKKSDFLNAPFQSQGQINQLAKMDVQLDNLKTKAKLFLASFTAKHGDEIIKVITEMTNAFLNLSKVLITLEEKFKMFEKLATLFKFFSDFFGGFNDTLTGKNDKNNKIEQFLLPGEIENKIYNKIKDILLFGDKIHPILNSITPVVPNSQNLGSNSQTNNINQNFYLQHEGREMVQNRSDLSTAVVEAMRMINNTRTT